MAVKIALKTLDTHTVIQYNNENKATEAVELQKSTAGKVITVKEAVDVSVNSGSTLLTNIMLYKDERYKVDKEDLVPIGKLTDDKPISPVSDTSVIIDASILVEDTDISWNKETANNETYIPFPLNSRPATWLDLIKHQEWVPLGYGWDDPKCTEWLNRLEGIQQNSINYEISDKGVGYYINEPTLNICQWDLNENCDVFENITIRKYKELYQMEPPETAQIQGTIIIQPRTYYSKSDRIRNMKFVFEAAFNKPNGAVKCIPGVVIVYLDDKYVQYYNDNPDEEIPLYAFRFSSHDIQISNNTLGFDFYVPIDYVRVNSNFLLEQSDPYKKLIKVDTITKFDNTKLNIKAYQNAPILSIKSYQFINFQVHKNVNLFLDSSDGIPCSSVNLCMFPEYTNDTGLLTQYRLIPSSRIVAAGSVIRKQSNNRIEWMPDSEFRSQTFTFELDPQETIFNTKRVSITQPIQAFGVSIEYNTELTCDGKPNTLSAFNIFDKVIIPQSSSLSLHIMPSWNNTFSIYQANWFIPAIYFKSQLDELDSICQDVGIKNYDTQNHLTETTQLVFTNRVYIIGNMPHEALQRSNAGITLHIQNVQLITPRKTETIQKLHFFFKDFTITNDAPIMYDFNSVIFCDGIKFRSFSDYIQNLYKPFNQYYKPIVNSKLDCEYLFYGKKRRMQFIVAYWYVPKQPGGLGDIVVS